MIDYGYRKTLSAKSDKELIIIVEQKVDMYHKDAILDAQNILAERGVEFNAPFPEEIKKEKILSFNDNSLWEYAYSLKRKGKRDTDILIELENKGAKRYEALLILKRLPVLKDVDPELEDLFPRVSKFNIVVTLILIIFLSVLTYFLFAGNVNKIAYKYGFISLVFLVASIIGLISHLNDSNRRKKWVSIINENPENIVWIKPIIEKTVLLNVVTLLKTRHFKLMANDATDVLIDCSSEKEAEFFLRRITVYLPHAHVGYTKEVQELYDADPKKFMVRMILNGDYTPIDKISLP